MGHLERALTDLAELATFRVQSENRAGRLWRDVVLARLSARSLHPLDVEERRLVGAVSAADQRISHILREL